MIDISLTDFVDFLSKNGTSRLVQVRELKRRPDYHPKRDYYREARDGIREAHEHRANVLDIAGITAAIKNEAKQAHYRAVLSGYQEFLSRKEVEFFRPSCGKWQQSDLSIKINPELGLVINDVPHLVKLYFKSDPLSGPKAQLITHTMEVSLRRRNAGGVVMSVLDTRRGKLYAPTVPVPGLDALLVSEAMAFLYLWQQL